MFESLLTGRSISLSNLIPACLDVLRPFAVFVNCRKYLATVLDSQWLGSSINEMSLSEIAGNIAFLPFHIINRELLTPASDGSHREDTLIWYRKYISSMADIFKCFKAVSAPGGQDFSRGVSFSNTLGLFNQRCESLFLLIEHDASFVYNVLGSRQLFSGDDLLIKVRRQKCFEYGKSAFEMMKVLIEQGGGGSCKSDPYLILI